MNPKSKITILSTFAEDKLINEQGKLLNKQAGGPAFYIKKALQNENADFILKTGPKMKVEILITKNGEFGKIPKIPTPKRIPFSKIKTPFLLISSLLDEFDLTDLPQFKGKVFLDIQGYVRNGKDFGKKKNWRPNSKTFVSIFCLKGTQEELQYLPAQYLRQQKQKLLLITKGKNGCEVFAFGKRYLVKPSKIVLCKNTIGAGDTFLSCFVSRFAKKEKVLPSLKYAMQKTTAFLSAQS